MVGQTSVIGATSPAYRLLWQTGGKHNTAPRRHAAARSGADRTSLAIFSGVRARRRAGKWHRHGLPAPVQPPETHAPLRLGCVAVASGRQAQTAHGTDRRRGAVLDRIDRIPPVRGLGRLCQPARGAAVVAGDAGWQRRVFPGDPQRLVGALEGSFADHRADGLCVQRLCDGLHAHRPGAWRPRDAADGGDDVRHVRAVHPQGVGGRFVRADDVRAGDDRVGLPATAGGTGCRRMGSLHHAGFGHAGGGGAGRTPEAAAAAAAGPEARAAAGTGRDPSDGHPRQPDRVDEPALPG